MCARHVRHLPAPPGADRARAGQRHATAGVAPCVGEGLGGRAQPDGSRRDPPGAARGQRMSGGRVTVVGGGLAGIAAALRSAELGASVTLLEVRPRLGGAAYSFERDGMTLDNGQHVFLRCCTAYRALLTRLGTERRTMLQDRLRIPVLAPGGRREWLRRNSLPAPLHLAGALARYGHLSRRERVRAARARPGPSRPNAAEEV